MFRGLTLIVPAVFFVAAPAQASGLSGKYVEARTCDVWVAPCFANAEMNLAGKNALMAWKIDHGSVDNVRLDGLSVIAVVAATDTLGLRQTGSSKALVIVDAKADKAQRNALVKLAKDQGGDLVRNVIDVQSSSIELSLGDCEGGTCALMEAGDLARIETRCINQKHDKTCGNEHPFYPPLAKNTKAKVAVALESSFSGKGLNATWKQSERRGAYVGTFELP